MPLRSDLLVGSIFVLAGCGASSPAPSGPAGAPPEPPASEPGPPPSDSPPGNQDVVQSPATPGTDAADAPKLQWVTKDTGVKVPDEWRKCAGDDECELVQTTCCDVCNGGKAAAVNKSKNADVKKKLAAACPANVACTRRGCSTRAACEQNLCVMQWESMAP